VDREIASRSINSGLLFAAVALVVFALAFFFSILYIA
jgi:hypothetical protein